MKHFWLDGDQQALMDSATSTANDYGYVGLFSAGKAWKLYVQGIVGSKVDERDYLRAYNAVRVMKNDGLNLTAIVRLNSKQAMMFKLRYQGTGDAWLLDDPTGESWGNMLIAKSDLARDFSKLTGFCKGTAIAAIHIAIEDGASFGPTLATVGNHCAGLPVSWASHLVWNKVNDWHIAKMPVDVAFVAPGPYREVFDALFDQPEQTYGQSWARQ